MLEYGRLRVVGGVRIGGRESDVPDGTGAVHAGLRASGVSVAVFTDRNRARPVRRRHSAGELHQVREGGRLCPASDRRGSRFKWFDRGRRGVVRGVLKSIHGELTTN